jgi:hypothetical protein
LVGTTPFVLQNQTYTFTIRASVGSSYNDKVFSFSILKQFTHATVLSAIIPVEEPARLASAINIWNPNIISDELIFRPQRDDNFGRVLAPRLQLGLRSFVQSTANDDQTNMIAALDKYRLDPISEWDPGTMADLVEYYSGLQVRLGGYRIAPVYSPNGDYIYDVIYIQVVDPQANAGGFIADVETPLFSNKISPPKRVYPKSLLNMRKSWIAFADSQESVDTGLALWQRKLGWQLVIEVAYTLPGQGQTALNRLNIRGSSVAGSDWTTGRAVISQWH